MTAECPNAEGGGQISTQATQRARSPSISILSPSLPSRQLSPHPKKLETQSPHLQTPSPKLPVHVKEVIDLVSPVSVIRQSSFYLRTPPPTLRVTEVINLVSPVESSTINLVTPPPKSKRLKVEPFSPKRDISIELPLNVLPEQKSTVIYPAPVHECESGLFSSLDAAILAVCDEEESLGHKWVRGQTKKTGGEVRHITMRCNHYRFATEQHSVAIDPANHRRGRSNKTDCRAHVNIIRDPLSALWKLNVPDWVHNHAPDIPLGGKASRPPTKKLQDAISTFATTTKLDRSDISTLIKQHPEYDSKHPLEPRQITNIVNAARRNARNEVIELGGDVNAVVGWLREHADEGWKNQLQIDDDQVVVGIWWQSPRQVDLTRRYTDLLIFDDAYNRNNVGYPLGIGIGIDNHGRSCNLWYVVHARENINTYTWILQAHLDSAGAPPEVVASDRHASLIHVVEAVMPLTCHVFCLHHLSGNVSTNVRNALGNEFSNFNRDFWATYRAVSPDDFQCKYDYLVTRYPAARRYLDEELYPCREQWAWAWISCIFTGGIRTNGRCEVENRITKAIGGPKKTLFQLFKGLNDRTQGQTVQEMIRVRDVSFSKFLTMILSS